MDENIRDNPDLDTQAQRNDDVDNVVQAGEAEEVENGNELTPQRITELDLEMIINQMSYLESKAKWHENSVKFFECEHNRVDNELKSHDQESQEMLVKFNEYEQRKKQCALTSAKLSSKSFMIKRLSTGHEKQLKQTLLQKENAEKRMKEIQEGRGYPETVEDMRCLLGWINQDQAGAPANAPPNAVWNPYANRQVQSHTRNQHYDLTSSPARRQESSGTQGQPFVVSPVHRGGRKETARMSLIPLGNKRSREGKDNDSISDEVKIGAGSHTRHENDDGDGDGDENDADGIEV